MNNEEEKRLLALKTSGELTQDTLSSKDKILAEITSRIKTAEEAQQAVLQARERAKATLDPEEQRRQLDEAFQQEKRAINELKIVQRLQSGVWQGGASGAGIGAGVGLGLGTVVGSIVGGVVAIPTTGLGLLAGAATGAIHGPWIKLGMGEDKSSKSVEAEDGEEGLKGGEI
jgi:ElaB/YqjD/DUF883 family membrane-anchored ribosome-binding protein